MRCNAPNIKDVPCRVKRLVKGCRISPLVLPAPLIQSIDDHCYKVQLLLPNVGRQSAKLVLLIS